MPTITLSGNYGYTPYRVSDLPAYTTVDARTATWIVANSRNQNPDSDTSYTEGSGNLNTYPVNIYGAGDGLRLWGGTIIGEVPQTSDWLYTYNNSAAVRVEYTPNVVIDDWRIDKAWDAFRIYTGATNFLIDDAYLTNLRDDALENDKGIESGTIRDSLFDGVFSGISTGDDNLTDGSNNTITLDHLFMRSQAYLYKGEVVHMSPFKANSSAPETTPNFRILDSVIAITDPNHEGQHRLAIAWDNVVESRGNVYLNLSDTPFPSDYPMPPAGFTVLQGQVARDYWEAVKAAWHDNHDGTPVSDVTALPPLPGQTVTPPPPPPPPPTTVTPPPPTTPTTDPATISRIIGDSGANTLIGTAGTEELHGGDGKDHLFGKGGYDILFGGAGDDRFVFDTALGANNVDRFADFDSSDDRIYLDNAIFTKLGSGSLSSPNRISSSWFEKGNGGMADDSNDFITYDQPSGRLFYDADGNGAGAPVQFAQVTPGTYVSASDFFVI